MSGIQKYIFDLKQAADNAKLLRARSFQLWALSEIIAEHLSVKFGVSRDCIITSAGGKFLLLAPNTKDVNEKLKEARLVLERHFLWEFAGKLSFVLSDGIPACGKDVRKDRIWDLINNIGTGAEWAKQRKMQAALAEDGAVLEGLYTNLRRNGECEYCGTLPNEKAGKGKEENLCRSCADMAEIGGRLLHANGNKIILKTDSITTFGEMVTITDKNDHSFGYTINEYKAGLPLMFLPYTAPYKDNYNLLTFGEIADRAVSDDITTGNKKLAMFKADVDNLGLIFNSSLGDELSLPNYAELSRRLHCFFSGFLAAFIRNNDDFNRKIYTVFSGGDDVCVLGAWDTVMRFALEFRNAFATWTNNNPSVTLSGGIALAGPTLPVRNIAEEAEAALEEAKGRKNNVGDTIKNGISTFGVTVSWEDYAKSLEDAKQIIQYTEEGKVTSAVVYKMIDFANRAKRAGYGNLRDMLWMSNYRYIVIRNIKSDYKDAIQFFSAFGNSPDLMEKSRIAVSYALYTGRKGKEE
jgi:CRISPR-associated protein Csm1